MTKALSIVLKELKEKNGSVKLLPPPHPPTLNPTGISTVRQHQLALCTPPANPPTQPSQHIALNPALGSSFQHHQTLLWTSHQLGLEENPSARLQGLSRQT